MALLITLLGFLYGPATLGQDLVRAGGIVFTGALLMLTMWDQHPPAVRAGLSAGFSFAAVTAWAASTGMTWEAVRQSFESQFQEAMRMLLARAPLTLEQTADMATTVEWMSRVYPAIGVLCAVLAGLVATSVAHQVAVRPIGRAPGSFLTFRFNDHLIWGAVATFGLGLLTLPAPAADLVANVAVLWVGLYAARGVAIAVAAVRRRARSLRLALFLTAVFLLPYAIGLALITGLADTWLDLRRFVKPAPSGDEGND